MRFKSCTVYALNIPFTEAFAHSAGSRAASDSIIVKLEARDGTVGYGEGVARPYVTGETVETSINHIRKVLWPAVSSSDYADLVPGADPLHALTGIDESLPEEKSDDVIAFNAARSCVEIALIDSLLRRRKMSLAEILPPRRTSLTYGAVISSGSLESSTSRARQLKLFGIQEVKIKIEDREGIARVLAVRETLGPRARLRVDANGAFNKEDAVKVAKEMAPLDIAAFEQPTPRKDGCDALREVRRQSPVPVMADESLVTIDDARALIESEACDYFNLRLSKCGGITRTLRIAREAVDAGIYLQLGSQVGETAILSAAGRHLVAHLERVEFVEGSYGKLLLAEDLSRDPIHFAYGGQARTLRGAGLGIEVREEVLERYAVKKIHLREDDTVHA
ncbi:MAG: enolase [Pyrinomonadaceae bacterium]|nr:enolase [Pyrinomonadaceae bacterium]